MDAKPLSCQQYPYIYYKTPRGVEVLLDHSCPEVIKNLGDPVKVEDVEQKLSSQFVLTVPETLPLTLKINLAWDDYLKLEETLLGILQLDLPLRSQVLCLHQLVAELGRHLEACGSLASPTVEPSLERIDDEKIQEVLGIIRKLKGSASRRDLYLAILLQLVEATYSRKLHDDGSASAPIFLRILKQWRGVGTETFEVFKLRVDHTRLKTVSWDENLPEFSEVIGRYLHYLVRSLLNTGRQPIMKRLAIVSANYALVDWLARAHAI